MKGITHLWQKSLMRAWHLGHLHENLFTCCLAFHQIKSVHWKLCLAIFASPLCGVSGLLWGHVLGNFSGYFPLQDCLLTSSPMLPPLLFKGRMALATLKGGPAHVINDPGALRCGTWMLPVFLLLLLSRKAGNRKAGNFPSHTTWSEHWFLLFHPLTLLSCVNDGWHQCDLWLLFICLWVINNRTNTQELSTFLLRFNFCKKLP